MCICINAYIDMCAHKHTHIYIYIYTHIYGGNFGVMIIIDENGYSEPSSNPG